MSQYCLAASFFNIRQSQNRNFIFLSARILEKFPQFTDIIESLIFQNFAYGARSTIFSQNGFFEEALSRKSAIDQQDEISNDVILF